MAALAHWTAIALYLAIAAIVGGAFASKRKPDNRLLLPLLAGALLAHGISLAHILFAPQGYRFDLLAMLSLVAWTVNLLILMLAFSRPLSTLLLVMAPLGALAELAAVHAWGGATPRQALTPGVAMHALLSIAAYSLLALATLQAIYLYFLNQQLHNHKVGGISRLLPPLQTMESLLFGLIAFGQLLLTASLVTGFLFLDDLFAQHLVHKTTLSLIAWCLYSALLWGHWKLGWRGNTAVRWTLAAFAVLMLAYFGSKLVLEVILQRS